MIDYKKTTLANGLTVVANRDESTLMAAVNIVYKVGARDEDPHRTGFAHLFEHLMFGGTKNVPDFDLPVQMACGENNAFTNNDYTDYYITLPSANIETALWLESDRMAGLAFSEKSLEVQRKVVIEEFNQRYLNQPYGDVWLLLRPLCYKVHPYRWATIGRTPDHIRDARIEDVEAFFKKYYCPSNAVLSISSPLKEEEAFALAEKWFGHIPPGRAEVKNIAPEPVQTEARRLMVERDVPATRIYIAYKMGGRLDADFGVCDVMSDVLSSGASSRLYQRLVKQAGVFAEVNAYVGGDVDPGLFVVTGQLHKGTTVEQAEQALLAELEEMKTVPVGDYELQKVKNKFEAGCLFGEINAMNKAMNLGFYQMLGDLPLVNREVEEHAAVSAEQIMETAKEIFRPENSSTLIYRSKSDEK